MYTGFGLLLYEGQWKVLVRYGFKINDFNLLLLKEINALLPG